MLKLMEPDQHPPVNEVVFATNNTCTRSFLGGGKISAGFLGLAYYDGTIWREAGTDLPCNIRHWVLFDND